MADTPAARYAAAQRLGKEQKTDALIALLDDEDVVVRESCLVALDAADYWGRTVSSERTDEAQKAESKSSLFAIQKADQPILVNHFNIKD